MAKTAKPAGSRKPASTARRAASGAKKRRAPKREARVAVPRLIHELQVHAEEITVQNEQLLRTQGELEDARDRFAALYDFAPIGYVSLNHHGVITEINLTGATMLGRPRSYLINL